MSTELNPFDLEAALRGEPVVTRNGREVTQVTSFETKSTFSIAAVIDGAIVKFTLGGKYHLSGDSENDLFMATKTVKKEGWVNLYKSYDGQRTIAANSIYGSMTEALYRPQFAKKPVATVKIEWEEEV